MMNKRRIFFALLLFLCVTALVSARGNRENVITVTGVVRLVGNEPFSEIVIAGSDYQWYIAKDEARKLHDLQHVTVTVEGIETVTELTFASGMPAGTRRELKKIKIVSVNR
jgi:hypothetical protein